MSSRRVKTLIQKGIRELKRDRDFLSGVDNSYSRGKSFEYEVRVTALDSECTRFGVEIIEFGGKKRRDWERHHSRHGERRPIFDPCSEDGEVKFYTLRPCCENEPDLGKARLVRRTGF